MNTDYNEKLFPQAEEGIKKVKWVKPEKVNKKLKNSYENIKLLLNN